MIDKLQNYDDIAIIKTAWNQCKQQQKLLCSMLDQVKRTIISIPIPKLDQTVSGIDL